MTGPAVTDCRAEVIFLHIMHLFMLDKSAIMQYNMQRDESLLPPVYSRDTRSYFISRVFAQKRTKKEVDTSIVFAVADCLEDGGN